MNLSRRALAAVLGACSLLLGWTITAQAGPGVPIVFDTDIGNDIDDALALGVIHALQSRGECELLAVTISKDNRHSAPFVDLVNTFYGRPEIPIGIVRDGKTPEDARYTREPVEALRDGRPRWPRAVAEGQPREDAVRLLRKTLAGQPDHSVALVVVGFSTNVARLLDSPPDDLSPLGGRALCEQKCRLLSMMAGMFSARDRHKEYNVYIDLPAARKVFAEWPGEIVASGYEVGAAVKYPATSIERDFNWTADHPLKAAYELYQKMPYDRETWDLTSVLFAVRPDRGYFGLSPAGTITVNAAEITQFEESGAGRQRYLTLTPDQAVRVQEALMLLASQPVAGR